MLLKGENELKIKDAIKENKECFEDLFDTIIPWEENFVAVDNLVWVRCRGLPLKLWNYDCFKHIAALLGTLIEVDEETLALEELEYARFRIRVTVGCEAKITSYMKINEVLYQVSVEEECTIPYYKLFQCHWNEDSKGFEIEADSITSNASVRSGSRDFEEGSKVVEEKSMAEVSMEPPPAVQGCRKSKRIAPLSCCKPLMARTTGPISAPILRSVIGKENLGSDRPTTLRTANVGKRCGLSDIAQCVENKVTYATEEGRCRSKNLKQAFSKLGLVGCKKELLWNGLSGSPVNSEFFYELHKTDQGGQQGSDSSTTRHVNTGNGAATALTINPLEVMGERRRKHPCKLKMTVQGAAVPIDEESTSAKMENAGENASTSAKVKVMKEGEHAQTSGKVVKEGKHDPTNSISRVEDSLCVTQIGEAYQSPFQHDSVEMKNKHTHIQFQSGLSLSRISDTYVPFEKPANKGYQLFADDMDNQKI